MVEGSVNTVSDWFSLGGGEYEVVLEYTATPYRAVQITGPADNCYPAEGGPEADSLSVDGKEVDISTPEFTPITERLLELAAEQMRNAA
jgi:hypothetical protein